ncbi:MAG: SUMF1/EgtB/PvdO family nonheme iron enzyme, partial [Cyanobacteria bacterium REEB65]|nr:SUMF1/EgtB/PvdO family nonheme iron enzyme [Cyanobacteria bacterium REEB65]
MTSLKSAQEWLADLEPLRACTLQLGAMVADAGWCQAPKIWHWSSIGWQFGHIATFEQAFVLERLKGDRPLNERLKTLFMPATAAPPDRISVPERDDLLAYVDLIRQHVEDYVGAVDRHRDLAFTLEMLVEHESMHLEHLLHLAYWLDPGLLHPVTGPMALAQAPARAAGPAELIALPGGAVLQGNPDLGGLWDNEQPAYETHVDPFRLCARPVTNGEFLKFVEGGGYHDRRWWSDAGWGAIELTGALHPYYWSAAGDGWRLRRLLGHV